MFGFVSSGRWGAQGRWQSAAICSSPVHLWKTMTRRTTTRQRFAMAASSASSEKAQKLVSQLIELIDCFDVKKLESIEGVEDDAMVPAMIDFLGEPDVKKRRNTVQALGMLGEKVFPYIAERMEGEMNQVEHATCFKVLTAILIYYPELCATIPDDILNRALDGFIADPVTRLTTSIFLAMVASDANHSTTREPVKGNRKALEMLRKVLLETDDPALGMGAVIALGSVGNGRDYGAKDYVKDTLRAFITEKEATDPEEGFEYAVETAQRTLQAL